LGIQFQVTSDI